MEVAAAQPAGDQARGEHGLGDPDAAAAPAAGRHAVVATRAAAAAAFGAPPGHQRGGQVLEPVRVHRGGRVRHRGGGPPEPGAGVVDGQGPVPGVVVAALPAGVPDVGVPVRTTP